jgi:flagellar P-ring protein precursor FlgI
MRINNHIIIWVSTFILSLVVNTAQADRVKDLTNVGGVRGNQLVGYGLVVGLAGTGDGKDPTFTGQSLKAILESLGVTTNPYDDYDLQQSRGRPIQVDNVAAVMVTATLPPFAKPGQVVDVNVAALGTATSLRGGNLVMTELRGIDGQTYAVAQGLLTVTGVMEEQNGTSIQIGIPTSGRIPDGATVERQVDNSFDKSDHLIFNVNSNDFSTTAAITEKINEVFGEGTAFAMDGVSLAVRAPVGLSERVSFVGMIENLEVVPGIPPAKVVINSRTGTVVINQQVKISAAAVSHGTVNVSVATLNEVSQPGPFTEGPGVETRDVANSTVEVSEGPGGTGLIEETVDLRDIVDAINQSGASTTSLIAILEALKSAGSLKAELVVI